MFLHLVALFDKKALTFTPVQTVPNVNAFIRVLSDEIARSDSTDIWAKHPEDFSLHQIGLFDDVIGEVQSDTNGNSMLCELSTLVRS